MNMIAKFSATLAAILSIGLAPKYVAADTFVREVNREFTAADGQTLEIDLGAGSIHVQPGDSDTVAIQILMTTKAGNEEKADKVFDSRVIEWDESDTDISLKIRQKDHSWFGAKSKSPKIKVTAVCPPEFNLNLDTGSGNVTVEDIAGKLVFDTGSGNVKGTGLAGEIIADTGSGHVVLIDAEGVIKADTGSGNVKVTDLKGTLDADTGSGNVMAKGALTRFYIDTGSGSISVSSSIAPESDSSADAGSGNVSIALPGEAQFAFQAETNTGIVTSDFPDITIHSQSKRSLEATAGQGGPEIEADTGSGNVNLTVH